MVRMKRRVSGVKRTGVAHHVWYMCVRSVCCACGAERARAVRVCARVCCDGRLVWRVRVVCEHVYLL